MQNLFYILLAEAKNHERLLKTRENKPIILQTHTRTLVVKSLQYKKQALQLSIKTLIIAKLPNARKLQIPEYAF